MSEENALDIPEGIVFRVKDSDNHSGLVGNLCRRLTEDDLKLNQNFPHALYLNDSDNVAMLYVTESGEPQLDGNTLYNGMNYDYFALADLEEVKEEMLNPIIKECLENNIPVELNLDGYVIRGFAKSGHATMSYVTNENGEYLLWLRYDTTETINNFQDLAWICFQRDRQYNNGWDWPDVFIKFGWLEKKTEIKTTYAIKEW